MNRFVVLILVSWFFTACVYHDTAPPDDCSLSDLHVSLDSVVDATSCAVQNGGIYLSVSGGKLPYNFYLNGSLKAGGHFESLPPGIYTVTVSDLNGCDSILTNISVHADGFLFTPIFEADTECLTDNGEVTIVVSDGNPPFQFRIDGGAFGNENTFADLSHGVHTVEVKDNIDCVISLHVSVPRGETDVSWTNDIKPIMEEYCATSGCHNGISRSNDLRKYPTAKFYSKSIKSKTQDRTMPFDGTLSQYQIDLIACWVDDGAQFN
jgi:hypothetical protein